MSKIIDSLIMQNTAEIKHQIEKIQRKIDELNGKLNELSSNVVDNTDEIYKIKQEKQEWELIVARYRYGLLQGDDSPAIKKNKGKNK